MRKKPPGFVERWVKEGKNSDFELVFHEYFRRLYWIVLKLTRNGEDTEEIVQESFWRLWQSRRKIRDPHATFGFLVRVANNLCYDRKRRRPDALDLGRVTIWEALRFAEVKGEPNQLVGLEVKEFIETCKAALSEEEWDLVEMRVIWGFSVRECAEVHDVSESMVTSQMHQTRQKIRAMYKNFGGNESNL